MPHTLQRRAGLEEAESLSEASVLLAEYSRKYGNRVCVVACVCVCVCCNVVVTIVRVCFALCCCFFYCLCSLLWYLFPHPRYTYEELVSGKYPKGIDVGRLEKYLSDDEFEEVFGMTPADFAILSSWYAVCGVVCCALCLLYCVLCVCVWLCGVCA